MTPRLSPATPLQLQTTICEEQYDPPAIGDQPVWIPTRAKTPRKKTAKRKPVPREESPQAERRPNRQHSLARASLRRRDLKSQRLLF